MSKKKKKYPIRWSRTALSQSENGQNVNDQVRFEFECVEC